MSLGISLFMSFQFKVHMPLVMQSVMTPLSALDVMVLKKYLIGTSTNKEGGSNIYNELLAPPNAENVAQLNAARAAASAAAGGSSAATASTEEPAKVADKPKTEEKDAKEAKESKDSKKKSTPAADLD
jgi:hypothetical protein